MSARCSRILFLSHTAQLGGGEIALINLLQQLDRRFFQPIIVLFSDGPLASRLRQASEEVHLLPLASAIADTRKDALGSWALFRVGAICRSLFFIRRLSRLIKSLAPDLVHTNTLKADILGGLASRLAGVPVVWHVRDRIADDYLPSCVASLFRRLARWIPRAVIVNSFSTLETLALHDADRLDALPPALDLSRFQIVHDGTDCPHLPSPPPQHDAPLIGLVGRISRWKGQHIFLQAAAKVRQRFPAARFQIIGAPLFSEENYQREIHALANKLGLDDCVDFTGFRSDVPQLIANLDLLVHASISGEPFGQVVIEGMAAAKPIVATRAGGIPEIVLEGETGLLVPPGNVDAMAEAIIRLLGDSAAAAEMGRRGHRRVRDFFTIERTTAGVQSVFQSLLGSSPSPIDSRRDAPSALLAHSRAG